MYVLLPFRLSFSFSLLSLLFFFAQIFAKIGALLDSPHWSKLVASVNHLSGPCAYTIVPEYLFSGGVGSDGGDVVGTALSLSLFLPYVIPFISSPLEPGECEKERIRARGREWDKAESRSKRSRCRSSHDGAEQHQKRRGRNRTISIPARNTRDSGSLLTRQLPYPDLARLAFAVFGSVRICPSVGHHPLTHAFASEHARSRERERAKSRRAGVAEVSRIGPVYVLFNESQNGIVGIHTTTMTNGSCC